MWTGSALSVVWCCDMFYPGYDMVDAMLFSLGGNPTAFLAVFWIMIGSIP